MVTQRITGVSDKIQVIRKTGTVDITDQIGWIMGAPWTIEHGTTTEGAIGGGYKPTTHLDNVIRTEFGFTTNPTSLKALQFLGTLSSAAGTWTINFTDDIPWHNIEANYTKDKKLKVEDLRFGTTTFTIAKGSPLEIVTTGLGIKPTFIDGTVTNNLPDEEKLHYLDYHLKWGGTTIGVVQNASFTLNPNLNSERGIENVAEGSRRLPTDITVGTLEITGNVLVEITDGGAFDDFLESTGPEDFRSDKTLQLVPNFDTTKGTVNILGARKINLNHDKTSEGSEIRTAGFDFTGLDITITGDEEA